MDPGAVYEAAVNVGEYAANNPEVLAAAPGVLAYASIFSMIVGERRGRKEAESANKDRETWEMWRVRLEGHEAGLKDWLMHPYRTLKYQEVSRNLDRQFQEELGSRYTAD